MDLKDIPLGSIRLSHSTMNLVNTCERKFQLEKLIAGAQEREASADTVLGTAYGVGVAHYLINQDREQALYETWMAYYPQLENEKKNQAKCIQALERAFSSLDSLLEEYEVVYFNDKPAAELSFCIRTGSKYYYVGYMDIVLRNKWTGKYLVADVKTTGLQLQNLDPIYKNSAQLIGYSIVLDSIVGEEQAEYDVMYLVAQLNKDYNPKISTFKYQKTLYDRLNWFLTLGMDIERLERMEELDVYPSRGESCLQYNRPCKYFSTCHLHSLDIPKAEVKDIIEYDFYYDMQTLINNHVQRIEQS